MFLEYHYTIPADLFTIRGTLSVDFTYHPPRNGRTRLDDSADEFCAVADSAEIIDPEGRVVGRIQLLVYEQQHAWGNAVVRADRENLEAACVAEGRRRRSSGVQPAGIRCEREEGRDGSVNYSYFSE